MLAHVWEHACFHCMYAASVQYAQRSCMNTYMFAHTQRRFLVFANKKTLVFAGACANVSAYGLFGGRAHALLSVWVHAYFCCAICNERWVLISFGDICGPASYCICGYGLTIPLPNTLPYYPRIHHHPCPLSQTTTIGGEFPPSIMGARRRNLRLARGSADSVCLRAHRYLHYAPPRPHTRPCTLTTFLHTATLHSHLLPANAAPPHSHLCLPVRFAERERLFLLHNRTDLRCRIAL